MKTCETRTVWLITGAASGVGLAIAKAALIRGDRVAATAAHLPVLIDALGISLKLASFEWTPDNGTQALHAARATVERFGRIDVLVNAHVGVCATTYGHESVSMTQAAIPHLRVTPDSTIIDIAAPVTDASCAHTLPIGSWRLRATAVHTGDVINGVVDATVLTRTILQLADAEGPPRHLALDPAGSVACVARQRERMNAAPFATVPKACVSCTSSTLPGFATWSPQSKTLDSSRSIHDSSTSIIH